MFFLDFGNRELAAVSELQPVPSQYSRIPAQAIPISLFNLTTGNKNVLAKEFAAFTEEVLLTAFCKTVDGQYVMATSFSAFMYRSSTNSHSCSIGRY